MASHEILSKAKAFLCWDVFNDLAIQLVPVQNAVAFYYPPQNNTRTIIVFYRQDSTELFEPLFLMFHEAGHAKQNYRMDEEDYNKKMNLPNGNEKIEFEIDAWNEGRILFKKFVEKENLDSRLCRQFDEYGVKAIESYS